VEEEQTDEADRRTTDRQTDRRRTDKRTLPHHQRNVPTILRSVRCRSRTCPHNQENVPTVAGALRILGNSRTIRKSDLPHPTFDKSRVLTSFGLGTPIRLATYFGSWVPYVILRINRARRRQGFPSFNFPWDQALSYSPYLLKLYLVVLIVAIFLIALIGGQILVLRHYVRETRTVEVSSSRVTSAATPV